MLFKQARPVWEKGKQYEMNYFLRVKTSLGRSNTSTLLKIAASSIYQLYINGEFINAGPARAAHGYYRVDELDIQKYLTEENNIVVIEVGGYNVNSYYLLDQPSFLQAEVECEGNILAATGQVGFIAEWMKEKVQKVQRYSFQRTFCEEYKLTPLEESSKRNNVVDEVELEITQDKKLISRGVEYETYDIRPVRTLVTQGSVIENKDKEVYIGDRHIEGISEVFKGFKRDELVGVISEEILKMDFIVEEAKMNQEVGSIKLEKDTFSLLDVGINSTGFIHMKVKAEGACRVYLTFDEILMDDDVNHLRLGCGNVVKYALEPGEYELLTVEPYTFRYLKVFVLEGECEVSDIHIKQVVAPGVYNTIDTDDQVLKAIYDAAVESYKQNAVDIYMDCPSRERAGWLCDSFFTSRVEYCLTGRSLIEKNFLENYLLPKSFKDLPEGMLPMCYPADHYDGVFIPNWAMWLVLELEEYLNRTGDRAMIDDFREKVYALLKYFERFENEDGLLEKLESWVFVEWSKSNELVQDVSYPTNMLYAHMLDVTSKLYGDQALRGKANQIKEVIREQSYDGEFFIDNSIRVEGKLKTSGERTESCQYYAFFCQVATPQTHRQLWERLVNDFGPNRKEKNKYPEIHFANAFIGNYLRLELLYRNGLHEKLMEEIKGYFYYMAEKTHTLWENDGDYASCNHGFASHVIYWIDNIVS